MSVHALLRANKASRATIFARDLLRVPQANSGDFFLFVESCNENYYTNTGYTKLCSTFRGVHALLRANHASRGTIFARDLLRIPQENPFFSSESVNENYYTSALIFLVIRNCVVIFVACTRCCVATTRRAAPASPTAFSVSCNFK